MGRDLERALLSGVLDDASGGRARATLLVGDPGVGKTALLADTVADALARGFQVVRIDSVESERGLPGAAVSLLVAGLGEVIDRLPAATADVLRATLRGVAGEQLPGSTLALVGGAAEVRPLLLVADDAQWCDPESLQALTFSARRLAADDVAILVAGRPSVLDRPDLGSLDRVLLEPLSRDAAIELLRAVAPDVVPEVALALVGSLGGNPLALTEAPALLDPRVRAGAVPLPVPVPVGAGVGRRWAQSVAELAEVDRRALAVLAADDTGSIEVLEQAWTAVGATGSDLQPAESLHLVRLTDRGWEFPNPIVRSAVFASLDPPERRRAHAAVAAALSGTGRGALYARHLAAASTGPDAAVADELERVADGLTAEGADTAAAYAADQSARATPPGPMHVARLLRAATLALHSLDDRSAADLAQRGLDLDPEPVTTARFTRVLGVAEGQHRDTRRAVGLLRDAARDLPGDERIGAYVDALAFVKMWNDPAASLELIAEMGDLDRLEPWMCLDVGNTLAAAGRWVDALPLLDRGLREVDPADPGIRKTVTDAWADSAAMRGLETELDRYRAAARRLRDSGSPLRSESGLAMEVELAHAEGRWVDADQVNEECRDLCVALGRVPLFSYGTDLRLAARRGDRERFDAAEGALRAAAELAGLLLVLDNADGLRATLALSCGDSEEAEPLLERTVAAAPPGMLVTTVFPSAAAALVELLARSGRAPEARAVADDVVDRLTVQPSRLAQAYAERIQGLVAPDGRAERHLRAAVELSSEGMHAFEGARSRLVLGEWLRRRRRRADAIEQLAPALTAFRSMGAGWWVDHCHEELRAAGVDVARADSYDVSVVLTAQERRVAAAAAEGLTNAAIARRMYLSPKTVELHLTHVYRKLAVPGRAALADALAKADSSI